MALNERQGKAALLQKEAIKAETAFQEAVKLDPGNSAFYTDLGDLYAEQAYNEKDPQQRTTLWQQSAQAWEGATMNEPNESRRTKFAEAAAVAFYNLAVQLSEGDETQRSQVRETLYTAQKYAAPGSPTSRKIDEFLDQLQG